MGWAQQCFPGSVQAWRQATFPISQNCMPIRSLESLTKHNLTKEMLCPPFISGHGAEKRQTKGGKKSTQSSRKHCLRCSKIYYRLRKRHGIRWGTALVDKVTAVHQMTAQMLYSAWVLPSYQELSPFWEWVMSYREPPFSAPTGTRKEWGEKECGQNNDTCFYSSLTLSVHDLHQYQHALSSKADWRGSLHRLQKHPHA